MYSFMKLTAHCLNYSPTTDVNINKSGDFKLTTARKKRRTAITIVIATDDPCNPATGYASQF